MEGDDTSHFFFALPDWPFFVFPEWYLSAALHPLEAGLLTMIPSGGVVSLLMGLFLGVRQREAKLTLFLLPFFLCQAFMLVATAMPGALPGQGSTIVVLLFLGFQLALAVYLVVFLKRARAAAICIAVFSVSYSLFAAFVAGMAFTERWL